MELSGNQEKETEVVLLSMGDIRWRTQMSGLSGELPHHVDSGLTTFREIFPVQNLPSIHGSEEFRTWV